MRIDSLKTKYLLLGKRVSFIEGDPGCLAIAAVIYRDLGDERMVNQCLER